MISSLVADGGFPPLTLQPVNFDQLYAQRMQQMMDEQKQGAAEQGNGEAVITEFAADD
jgi:preprotein translocase subunit SecB